MPGVAFVLGDTAAEAQEKAAEIRGRQVSPQNAILALEQIWGVDLSSYDPDGPLPDIDPVPDSGLVRGRVRVADPFAVAEKWRALSREKGLSIRQTVIEASGRRPSSAPPSGRRRARRVRARPTRPTASSSYRIRPRAASTSSWTGSSRSCRSAACSGRSTPAPRCAHTSGWPEPAWKG